MDNSQLSDPGYVEILRQLGSFAGNVSNLFAFGYKEVAITGRQPIVGTHLKQTGGSSAVLQRLHDDACKLKELKQQQAQAARQEAAATKAAAVAAVAAELISAKAQSASTLALATLKQSKGGILKGLLSRSSSLDISEPDQHAIQTGNLGRCHSLKATSASKHGHAGQKAAAGPDDAMLQSLDKGAGPLTTSRSLRQREQEQRVLRASLDDAGVVVVVSKGLDRVAEDDREGQESPTPREKQHKDGAAEPPAVRASVNALGASTGSLVTLRHDRRISGAEEQAMPASPAAVAARAMQSNGLNASLDSFSFGHAADTAEEVASPHLLRTSTLIASVNSRLALTSDATVPLPSSSSPIPTTHHPSSTLIAAARASGPLTRSLSIRQSVNQADLYEQENDRFRAAQLAQQASKQAAESLQAPLQPVAPLSKGLLRQSSGAVPGPPAFLRTPGHSRAASVDGEAVAELRQEGSRGLSTWGSATLYASNSMRRMSHAGSGMALMLPATSMRPALSQQVAPAAAMATAAGQASAEQATAVTEDSAQHVAAQQTPSALDPAFLDAAQQQAALAAELRQSISRMTGVESDKSSELASEAASEEASEQLSPSSSADITAAAEKVGDAEVLIIEETAEPGAQHPADESSGGPVMQLRVHNLKAAALAAASAQPQAMLAQAAVEPQAAPAGALQAGSRQASLDVAAAAAAALPQPAPIAMQHAVQHQQQQQQQHQQQQQQQQQQAVLVEGMGKAALDILGRKSIDGSGTAAKKDASLLERSGSAQISLAQVYEQTAKAEMNPLAAGLVKHRSTQALARPRESDPGGLPPPGPGMRPLQRSATTPSSTTAYHTTPSPRLLNEETPSVGPLSAAQPKPTPRPKPSASPAYARVSPRQWQRLGLPAGPGAPLADPYINLQSYNNKYYESWFKEEATATAETLVSTAPEEAVVTAMPHQQQQQQQHWPQEQQQHWQQGQQKQARVPAERQQRRRGTNGASRQQDPQRSGYHSDSSGAYASAEESEAGAKQSYPGGRRTTLNTPPTFLRTASGQQLAPSPQQQQQEQQGQQARIQSSPVPTPPAFLQGTISRRTSDTQSHSNGHHQQQQPLQPARSRHAAAAAAVERMQQQHKASLSRPQFVQPGYESQYEQEEDEGRAAAGQLPNEQLPRRASMHGMAASGRNDYSIAAEHGDHTSQHRTNSAMQQRQQVGQAAAGVAESRAYAPAAPTAPPPPLSATASFAPRSGGLSPSMSLQSAYSLGGASSNYASARTSLADSLQSSGSRVITAVDMARARMRMSRASDAAEDVRYANSRRGSDAGLAFGNGGSSSYGGAAQGNGYAVGPRYGVGSDPSPRSGSVSE